jgi:hypothetical protein
MTMSVLRVNEIRINEIRNLESKNTSGSSKSQLTSDREKNMVSLLSRWLNLTSPQRLAKSSQ